jgi:hypothetical protein
MTLSHGGKLKYCSNLLWNFNPRKCRYSGKLPCHFYNIGPMGLYHKAYYGGNLQISILS